MRGMLPGNGYVTQTIENGELRIENYDYYDLIQRHQDDDGEAEAPSDGVALAGVSVD